VTPVDEKDFKRALLPHDRELRDFIIAAGVVLTLFADERMVWDGAVRNLVGQIAKKAD
jgi:hypothetical protein